MFGLRRILFAVFLFLWAAICVPAEKVPANIGLPAWNSVLEEYSAGTLNVRRSHEVTAGTPAILAKILADDGRDSDLKIIIDKSILDKSTGKTPSRFTGTFHHIAMEDLRNLPMILCAPIAVFDSETREGDKVLLTSVKDAETGESVVIALAVGTTRKHAKVNAISSILGRATRSFVKWIRNGKLRYANTKKFPRWLESVGVQIAEEPSRNGKKILSEKDFAKNDRAALIVQ